MPQSSLIKIPETSATPFAARHSSLLQRKSDQTSARRTTSAEAPPIVHEVLRSPGQPLDAASRAFMEPRFGYSFAGVQVHPDARAADSADAVDAHAYTVGRHVVFGRGQYAPGSPTGQRLLAHELTHVVQQSGRQTGGSLQVAQANDHAESAADHVLSGGRESDFAGRRPRVQQSSGGETLQRQPKEPETKKEETPEPSGSDKMPASPTAASNKCPPFPAPGFEAVVSNEGLGSPVGDVFKAGDGDLTVGVGEAFDLSYHSVAGVDTHTSPPPVFFGGLHWVKRGSGTLNADETSGAGKWTAPETPGDVTLVIRTVAQNCEMARVKIHVVEHPKEKKPKSKPTSAAQEPKPPPFNWNVTNKIIAEARDRHATAWDAFVDVYSQRNAPGHSTDEVAPCLDPNLAAADHYLFARTLVMDFGYPAIFVKSFNSLYESFKNDLLSHGIDPKLGSCATSPGTPEQEWAGEVGADSGSLIGHPELWNYKPFGRDKNYTGTHF
jgi:hypothetical protein